jgi:hypothetical protein
LAPGWNFFVNARSLHLFSRSFQNCGNDTSNCRQAWAPDPSFTRTSFRFEFLSAVEVTAVVVVHNNRGLRGFNATAISGSPVWSTTVATSALVGAFNRTRISLEEVPGNRTTNLVLLTVTTSTSTTTTTIQQIDAVMLIGRDPLATTTTTRPRTPSPTPKPTPAPTPQPAPFVLTPSSQRTPLLPTLPWPLTTGPSLPTGATGAPSPLTMLFATGPSLPPGATGAPSPLSSLLTTDTRATGLPEATTLRTDAATPNGQQDAPSASEGINPLVFLAIPAAIILIAIAIGIFCALRKRSEKAEPAQPVHLAPFESARDEYGALELSSSGRTNHYQPAPLNTASALVAVGVYQTAPGAASVGQYGASPMATAQEDSGAYRQLELT